MDLQTLLGIELPIIQAPMAAVQLGALAAAVTGAGGLGSLPCTFLTPDGIRAELAAMPRGPYNVNFLCHVAPVVDAAREAAWRVALAPYFAEHGIDPDAIPAAAPRASFTEETCAVLEEVRPAVVSFHFGLPAPALLARVRATGAKVLSSATTVDEARWLEARGVDAIIAQGAEAGGHRAMFLTDDVTTQVGTLALVPQIVAAVGVPVIAAGGIADAAGVAAVMGLGAAGAQIGTAYLLCPETTTTPLHRRALAGDEARHTALTNLFSGRPARAIVNRLMRERGPMSAAPPAFPLAAAAIAPLRAAAEHAGLADFSPLWCGQNARGCREVPAADLTRALAP